MAIFHNHIGFNIFNSRLQLVEVDCSQKSKIFIRTIEEEFFNEFFEPDTKETKVISLLQSAYDEIIFRNPLKATYASFSLPSNFFFYMEIPSEEALIKKDLNEFIKWNFSVLYPQENLNEIIFQQFVLTNFQNGKKTEVVFGISRRILKILHKFCSRNNLILKNIDNSHIAINSLFINQQETLSAFITTNMISISFAENNNPLYYAQKSFSSISNFVKAVEYHNFKLTSFNLKSRIQNAKILVTGENITDSMLQQLGNELQVIPVKFNPFENLTISEKMMNNENYSMRFNSFAAPLALSLRTI